MSSINSINRSMLRITGMNSGFDTESMVSSLLRIDQMRVDKQFKLKTKLEWKGDAYRTVNTQLRDFRSKYMSTLSPETNVFSSAAFNNFKVTMLTETKAVDVSAGPTASSGTITIDEIAQLAEGVTVAGNGSVAASVNDENFAMGMTVGDAVAKGFFGSQAAMDAAGGNFFDAVSGNFNFFVNGEEIVVNKDQTFHEMVSQVNTKVDGVRMSYSELRGGFMFTSSATGAEATVTLSNQALTNDGPAKQGAGNAFGANGILGMAEGTTNGKNAIMYIKDAANPSGPALKVERGSNSFSVDGVGYNLKEVTGPNANIRVSVERDNEATIEKVKAFVEGYNELIDSLNGKLTEKVNRSYDPLTDDEKSALSEKQAEKWDELARSGLLRNDSFLSGLMSSMRSAFYTPVEAAGGLTGADVGITTTADYTSGGKITLNEDTLRRALERNPDQVAAVFTNVSSSQDASTKHAESGIITRVSEAMVSFTSNVTDQALTTNTRLIRDAEDKLSELEDWLTMQEDKYWRQFTAMETALSSLNSQTQSLVSMLGQNQK